GMLRALSYGAPPHGGIAPGIDRIVMLLCGEENLREVVLFPMNQRAEDLLMGAPSEVSPKQLRELHIRINLPASATQAPKVSLKEVEEFSAHCVYIRSVYTFAIRIFRDVDDAERKAMEATARVFFNNMSMVVSEFLVNAVCRITEPAIDRFGNHNTTVELFLNSFPRDGETFKQLNALRQRIDKLRDKVVTARNNLGAHADRFVILKGEPLLTATWQEWDDFWSALRDFVRILNEKTTGKALDIDAPGMLREAESLLRALSSGSRP